MCSHMHMHTPSHMQHMHTHTLTHRDVHMHTYTGTHRCTHAHTLTHRDACIHAYTHWHMHTETHTCHQESAFPPFQDIQTLGSKVVGSAGSSVSHPFCVSLSTGTHCELYKDPCANVSCLNGGTCDSEGLNGTCVCTPGFAGKWPRNWDSIFTQNPQDGRC